MQFLEYPKSDATTLFRITQTQFLPTRCFAQNTSARQETDKPNAFQVAFLRSSRRVGTRCPRVALRNNTLARQAADKPNTFQVAFLWATSAPPTADTARQFSGCLQAPKAA